MNKRGTISIWDILAWIVLAGILIWVILKVLGIINTPLLLEYSPLFGVVYLAGWAMHKLDQTTDDVRDIKRELRFMEKDMGAIKSKCPAFKR